MAAVLLLLRVRVEYARAVVCEGAGCQAVASVCSAGLSCLSLCRCGEEVARLCVGTARQERVGEEAMRCDFDSAALDRVRLRSVAAQHRLLLLEMAAVRGVKREDSISIVTSQTNHHRFPSSSPVLLVLRHTKACSPSANPHESNRPHAGSSISVW